MSLELESLYWGHCGVVRSLFSVSSSSKEGAGDHLTLGRLAEKFERVLCDIKLPQRRGLAVWTFSTFSPCIFCAVSIYKALWQVHGVEGPYYILGG